MEVDIWRRAEHLEDVRIAPGFHGIVRSDRLAKTLKGGVDSRCVTLAACDGGELVGYATLVPATTLTGERWEGLDCTFELGALEVARDWRRRGVASALLAALEVCLPLEELVVFTRSFASHWDMPVVETSAFRRRTLILQILRRAGFEWQHTDDPEVATDPLNFLCVRYGLRAPSEAVVAFHELLVSPPTVRAWRYGGSRRPPSPR